MDNIDSLMTKFSLSKPKKHKEEDSTSINFSLGTNLSTLASSPDSFENNDQLFLSPKSPMFRPQQTPTDMIPEMLLLPESEVNSQIIEEELEMEKQEINPYLKNNKRFSCPNGPTLSIWVGNSKKEDCGFDFEMIEENDADMLCLDSPHNKKSKEIKGFDQSPNKQSFGFSNNNGLDLKRVRSQSENITACTIFKFMEGTKVSKKKQI